MVNLFEDLDIQLMQEAANHFVGTHDFRNYSYKPTPQTQTVMEVLTCEIVNNTLVTASFFPEDSYLLRVRGEGFKRHQIRLMMGALIDVGRHALSLDDLINSIDGKKAFTLTHIAQASGLMLHDMELKDFD